MDIFDIANRGSTTKDHKITLSKELQWHDFINQTTYKDLSVLDGEPTSFYLCIRQSFLAQVIYNYAFYQSGQ